MAKTTKTVKIWAAGEREQLAHDCVSDLAAWYEKYRVLFDESNMVTYSINQHYGYLLKRVTTLEDIIDPVLSDE